MSHFRFRYWAFVAFSLATILKSASAAQIDTFGKLKISADDNSFSARLTGTIQMDADFYEKGTLEKSLPSGSYVRRARIGVTGNLREWEYAVESDFASDKTELKDGYLRRIIGTGKITIGQFKVFEGFERLTNANDITFIERTYVSDIVPGYQIGFGYNGTVGMLGFAGTVYNLREAADAEARPTNSGVGAVGRGYIAPVNERRMALHFGGSYAHENTDSLGLRVRVSPAGRAEQYNDLSDFRFVVFDRRDEHVNINRVNLEGLAVNGPLSVQGEYMMGSADTKSKVADDFNTWYAQLSYILTGEAREYKFLKGEISRPEPTRDIGAFEIAARYQQVEREKVTGAKLKDTEFGLTYYANTNVRFMLNYALVDNELTGDDPRLLSMRAQFDF